MACHNTTEYQGLPFLWCWAFYFVKPSFDFSPDTFDGAEFKTGLFNNVGEAEFLKESFEFY